MPLETATIACDAALTLQPRARGKVRLAVRNRDGRTVLDRLHQAGSSKLLLPRDQAPDRTAVLLNTAGGVTGGDQFSTIVEAGDGTALSIASQTAERAYRAQPGQTGEVHTRLSAGVGATLQWLPQETILFDGCALSRRLEVDLAHGARFLAAEPVILGRTAMGETVRSAQFSDYWRIRRAGRLIYADALRLSGNIDVELRGSATLGAQRAFASILLAAPDAERYLSPLRALLPATAGATVVRDGVLAARLIAPNGLELRRALVAALELLRGHSLPTVWKM